MENLKIRVNSEAESKEAQELFFELGYQWPASGSKASYLDNKIIHAWSDGYLTVCDLEYTGLSGLKEVSLPELRALVSLHKNPINMDKVLSEVRYDALGLLKDKEYLNKETHIYVKTNNLVSKDSNWIEIPEGAKKATKLEAEIVFWNSDDSFAFNLDDKWSSQPDSMFFNTYVESYDGVETIWHRPTLPEELPFVDDESLNDQYAEIEQVRQESQKWSNLPVGCCADAKPNQTPINAMNEADTLLADAVNHPSHYASSSIECIDAMEAMLTPEQFIGYLRGNSFKYMWRYENKGGITDLEKAQWYLNKLISRIG